MFSSQLELQICKYDHLTDRKEGDGVLGIIKLEV